ncbi:diguanylate cyclase [Methylopila jiangsuensis]|uniref:Diguanylate cyclase n=2 Tax=Methylopila jiangsuensis TaxID=586230 RepID=A0A9W6JHT4_9HYPH|nr:diguanylate cyclase (GGDEF)-like protein [Methylopila jiangsuensis]GLK76671.1 diguanylate cyclase [Methylopila jiangsuensis]
MPGTVVLAALIAAGGLLAFFLLLSRAEECADVRRSRWLAVGAVAGGLSIWAVHFVAMLGYRSVVDFTFDPALTLVSAAIVCVGFRLAIALRRPDRPLSALSAGTVAALAVAAMHFVGMAAMRVAATVSYDWPPVVAALAIAAAAMAAAFLRFRALTGAFRLVEPAAWMILGVCALHFTAMSATTLTPDPRLALDPALSGRQHGWLIGAVFGVACLVALITSLAVVLDRYLTDLKGFADATLEGLAVVRDGRIIEANARFAALMDTPEKELIGRDPDACIVAADGLPAAAARPAAIEAAPRTGDPERAFELAVSTIEFRGRPSQVLAVMDLTEKKQAQAEIERLALYDGLTGLPNRTLLRDRLDKALARAKRSGETIALLALDLDRFKAVNDLFGHAEGDRVLKTVAAILSRTVRGADTVARLGGDEFVILQVGAAQPEGARALAQRIFDAFRMEMNAAMDPTAVGVSIGVALTPDDATETESLLSSADIALYRAKSAGRGTVAFYDLHMDQAVRARRRLEADLRGAIQRSEMRVVYQPVVDVEGRPVSYEALLRWRSPDHGDVAPDVFIPLAEDTGAIIALGEWVLREACRAAAGWDERLSIAVNVSPVQFRVANLADQVSAILAETGLAPERLGLEITETALMRSREETLQTLRRLKALGVKIIMDDFGTGYSSLSNLQSFPFDKIKIDRSFITAMGDDRGAKAIVTAIVGLGRSLDLPVVAEGVETEAQRQMVVLEGCTEAQGYLFGRPGAAPQAAGAQARTAVGSSG